MKNDKRLIVDSIRELFGLSFLLSILIHYIFFGNVFIKWQLFSKKVLNRSLSTGGRGKIYLF
jgi:hypothetical protein